MTGKKYVIMLLTLVGLVVGFVYGAGLTIGLEDTISLENYLAKLNDNDTYGCKNSIRVKPEILVLGDSHAYAAIDFNMLADGFGTRRIAACTLGGSYLETFIFALRFYEAAGKLPAIVIIETSPREFWDDESKAMKIFGQTAQIKAINSGDLFFSAQNLGAWLFRSDGEVHKEALERLARHRERVEALSEAHIADVLERFALRAPHLADWTRRIREARYTKGGEGLIAELGEIVRRNGIDLYVVGTPESPWLEGRYPATVTARYHGLLELFRPFSRKVLVYSARDVGLGNRHYINRSLSDKYDYSKWEEPGYNSSVDLDGDHMSAVGAEIFTRRIVKDFLAP